MSDIVDSNILLDALREMLRHLYDPLAVVPDMLAEALGVPADDPACMQEMLMRAIQRMQPAVGVPDDTRAWRLYELLRLRYLEHLTQEETAQRLSITVRHLGREQNAAIELLAQALSIESQGGLGEGGTGEAGSPGRLTRSAQVEAEVAALGTHSGASATKVVPAIEQTLVLLGEWFARKQVRVCLGDSDAELATAVHPSLLHQVLTATASYIVRTLGEGVVELSANEGAGEVVIRVLTHPALGSAPPDDWIVRELIETQGGTCRFVDEPDHTLLQITLPSVRSIKVLVLDDNVDLVHFYRLCLAETPYRMVHLAEGQRVFEVIAREEPQVIVLDLMLPDVDGWELLSQLHEHPSSRGLPIIVCSVVHEEELALALGACACVNKPVRRQQLLAALDAALNRAASSSLKGSESSAAAW